MASWWWLLAQLVLWCTAGLVAVLWWLWVTRPRVDAPGPPTLPIIGNILDFVEVPLTLRKLRDFHQQYGHLTRFYMGPIPLIMVTHPDDVQHILLTSKLVDRDPFSTHAMRMFVGDGLLTLNGSRWKVHRKLINPTFHSGLLGNFLEGFHDGGVFMSERLARSEGAVTEVHYAAFFAGLRAICSTAAGIDPELLFPDNVAEEEISTLIKDGMTIMQKMILRPWMQIALLLKLTAKGRSIFKYMGMLRERTEQCIAMRAAATEEGPAKTRLRLLETLVKPGGHTAIPLSEVSDELMTMAMASTETISVCISYVLALVALHPEWQDAVHKELREVFGDGDDYLRSASLAELASLRVLESVIKETLRLFPVVPVIPRKVKEDIWLSGGRVLVPKGTLLAVMPCITHRLPQFFPDPLRFDPSRFLEGQGGEEHPCSYLPFGMGARNCVGSQYARLELKVFLATVLRRFRFLPHSSWEDLDHCAISISLHTIKPISVRCVPLQGPGL